MKYIIYLVKSPNNKYYVGLTGRSLKMRKDQHINEANNNSDLKFHKAIKKYGNKLIWKEIARIFDRQHAFLIEAFFIKEFDSYNNGYNSTLGGEGRCIESKYTNESLLDIAQKFKTKSDWYKTDYASYQNARSNKELFDMCTIHMNNGYIEYSDEQILLDAKKYKSIRDWRTNSKNIYQIAQRRGDIFNKCKSFLTSEKHHWTDEELLILSKQYNTKKDWENGNPTSYRAARRRSELYKICTIHMKSKSKMRIK